VVQLLSALLPPAIGLIKDISFSVLVVFDGETIEGVPPLW